MSTTILTNYTKLVIIGWLFGWASPCLGTGKPDGIIAFGSLRGYTSSCGCSPDTDFGGLGRLGRFISSQRGLGSDTLLINLGGNLGKEDQKNDLIKGVISKLPLSASLPDQVPLKGAGVITAHKMVLSHGNGVFPPVRYAGKHAIYGYNQQLGSFNVAELAKVLSRTKKNYRTILLFHGDDSVLQQVIAARLFDQVISRNHRQHMVPDQLERKNPGLLLRLNEVSSVPSFGQGVLVFGMQKSSPGLELTKQSSLTPTKKSASFALSNLSPYRWLDRSWDLEIKTKIDPLLAAFEGRQQDEFVKRAQRLSQSKVEHGFVGADSCRACHLKSYKVWENTRHSRAWRTLKEKEKHQVGECVSCHVVGFEAGAFVNKETTPHLAGVQCENCHGPGQDHLDNLSQNSMKASLEQCASCHHPPHIDTFDAKSQFTIIEH